MNLNGFNYTILMTKIPYDFFDDFLMMFIVGVSKLDQGQLK